MSQFSARAKREAVRLYDTGLSCRAVAEKMKVEGQASPHYVTVLRWAKEAGNGRKQRGHRFPIIGEAIRVLYDGGMHVDEIARRFDVGTTTIYKRLNEAGAKLRPSRVKLRPRPHGGAP